jgi:translation initiation factor 1
MDTINIEPEPLDIHIKIQQRKGRSFITTVEGLQHIAIPENKTIDQVLDILLTKFKKQFNCGASISKEDGLYIFKLSGDKRNDVKDFLLKNNLAELNQIKIHGF